MHRVDQLGEHVPVHGPALVLRTAANGGDEAGLHGQVADQDQGLLRGEPGSRYEHGFQIEVVVLAEVGEKKLTVPVDQAGEFVASPG